MKFLIFTLFLFFTTVYGEDTDPLPCNCHLGNSNRIINGQVANKHFIPWMVFLVHSKGYCGGTIVNKNYILTAAHCVDNIPAQNITVYLGIQNLSELNVSSIYKGKNITKADFTTPFKEGDFALIELVKPIEFITRKIEPACFNLEDDNFEGDLLTAGWGKTARTYIYYDDKARIKYLPQNDKNLKYFFGTQVTDDCRDFNICMRPKNESDSTCHGDSGGPLMHNKNGKTSVIGLVLSSDSSFDREKLIITMCTGINRFAKLKLYKDLIERYAVKYCKI